MTKIIIKTIEEKMGRDGKQIGGTTKYGKPWKILKINGEYDCADFLLKGYKEGSEIDCEVEDGQWGKKIKSVAPKEVILPLDTYKKMIAKIKEMDDRLGSIENIVRQ